MKEAFEAALGASVTGAVLLAGGASKEAWAVDTADGRELLVRRAGGGVIHEGTLSLRDEFEVLVAAREAGVKVPEPIAYLGEVDGREAFVMERVAGETIGRRIVKRLRRRSRARWRTSWQRSTRSRSAGFRSFATPTPSTSSTGSSTRSKSRTRRSSSACLGAGADPARAPRVVGHGDFRLGNLAVDESGLVSVLDWEFAHVSDPAEDLAWPLCGRGASDGTTCGMGGVGEIEPYVDRYAELTGRRFRSKSSTPGRCSETASGRSVRCGRGAATCAAKTGASSSRSSAVSPRRWSTRSST